MQHDLPEKQPAVAVDEHPLGARFAAFLAGGVDDFADIEIDLDWCTPFQADVAAALRAVPYGEVVAYGELAALAGYPRAGRAAGSFCARNRLSLVLPCHRVVAADHERQVVAGGSGIGERVLQLGALG